MVEPYSVLDFSSVEKPSLGEEPNSLSVVLKVLSVELSNPSVVEARSKLEPKSVVEPSIVGDSNSVVEPYPVAALLCTKGSVVLTGSSVSYSILELISVVKPSSVETSVSVVLANISVVLYSGLDKPSSVVKSVENLELSLVLSYSTVVESLKSPPVAVNSEVPCSVLPASSVVDSKNDPVLKSKSLVDLSESVVERG